MLKKLIATVRRMLSTLSAAQLKWGAFALAASMAIFVSVVAQPVGLERSVAGLRNEINTRPASGTIVLVEIDAKSIRSIDKWPWPRTLHAQLVDRLNAAGASQIAFDVDFSSRSVDADDLAFAEAIARAGGKVILPTFRQPASDGKSDLFVENQPIEILRNEAFLGGVNIRPDADGRVNTYPYGTLTGGMPRPSIGALLADASGPIDHVFPIDHSIDINSIPRLSYADILAGDFELSAIEGKRVIVGATAIELGDHYATDRFGVVPGVTLQVLAAETMLAGLVLPSMGPWPLLLFVTICVLVGSRLRRDQLLISRITALASALLVFGLSVLAHRFAFAALDTVPAFIFLAGCLAGQLAIDVITGIERDRLQDHATRLPNLAAWKRDNVRENVANVIVARCANFGEILSTLTEEESVDLVLQIAERLKLSCGITELYRIEHDQFCWKLEDASFEDVGSLLEGASSLFNAPIRVGDRSIRANFCFGVAKDECSDPGKLCGQGVLAAKHAYVMGVRIMWYTENFAVDIDHELFIVSEFLEALERGDVSVVYQPKFSIAEGRVTSAEALLRWNDTSRGPLSPSVFIPVLEKANLIAPLTLFVLRKALESLALWNKTGEPKTCAVNLSALLLSDTMFVDEAIDLIRRSEIDPSYLTLELTETAVLTSVEMASSALALFASLGTKLSVDDYGTGQSTLSYLKNFAASEIKIDQSFVGQIETMDANRIMVRSTIEMAHALGLSVVAEGVENESVMKILCDYGCDVLQGWHIGAGVPCDQFMENWGGGASDPVDCATDRAVRERISKAG